MGTYVALLRGINVGGHNKIAMADLKRVIEELGHTEVRTYVNSGNVVFEATGRATANEGDRLGGVIEKAIKAELGVSSAVLVRTAAELAQVAKANPYADETDPKKVHVVFLPSTATAADRKAAKALQQQAADRGSDDELALIKRAAYLHTPSGYGRSVLAEILSRKKASPTSNGTARNWSTVTKLLSMVGDAD
jgi:uncharacterized protein (DUF1697 family)